jgi:CubicO group peptidase (beta-lactamase class C family)
MLAAFLEKKAPKGIIKGISVAVQQGNGPEMVAADGDLSVAQPFFVASTTKLITTACILQLVAQSKLNL